MDEKESRKILNYYITPSNALAEDLDGERILWPISLIYEEVLNENLEYVSLNGEFNIDELKAIIWWMENKDLLCEERDE